MNAAYLAFSLVVASSLALSACASDDGASPGRDTAGAEILFPDGSVHIETVSPPDAETIDPSASDATTDTLSETTVPDTASDTMPDLVVADTVTDTTPDVVPDTGVDTVVADTTPDTIAPDTVADTTPDTIVPDTVADTTPDTVADTTPADTSPDPDTTPVCQEGGCATDITKLGNTCATAYVIGRPNALSGFGHLGSTIGAGNNSDFTHAACGDSGPDRFYKIYLKVGEQLWVNANPSPAAYDLTYGLYRGQNCETQITCVDNDLNGTTPDTMPYQAVVEGWHVLVVDGRSTQGDYSLVVTLDCQEEDCCCGP